jgi:hypothetical protein
VFRAFRRTPCAFAPPASPTRRRRHWRAAR